MGRLAATISTGGPRPATLLVWLLLMVVLAGSSSGTTDVGYERRDYYRCGHIFKTASVPSLTACAAFCTQESECTGFNIGINRGRQRECQISSDDIECAYDSTYHYYRIPPPLTTTTADPTTTTTLPTYIIELKYFPISSKSCSPGRIITTIVTKPGYPNMTDIIAFVCSKFKSGISCSIDDFVESVTTGDINQPGAVTCPTQSMLMGLEGINNNGGESFIKPDVLQGNCHALSVCYVDESRCLTVYASHELVTWTDGKDKDKVDTTVWDNYLTCPDNYLANQIQRKQTASGWQIFSMNCCLIVSTPP
ncbi:uncharacterized protein LOC121880001 [Homarus americanus]|uniref:Apple domain-containing protein n=1 Tax=Homarus americanus TaxID=6706 RepID=A0A8J5JQJ8_HOMAM|nr:uncharacterized protein LOC121880001 [Homarus americanus]KAG7157389.1 hypothetical protein Hamer_G005812 [Homarus americanus]